MAAKEQFVNMLKDGVVLHKFGRSGKLGHERTFKLEADGLDVASYQYVNADGALGTYLFCMLTQVFLPFALLSALLLSALSQDQMEKARRQHIPSRP